MDPRFAVLRHLKALDYKDTRDASDWLSDDLVFNATVRPLNKEETLSLFECIFEAFPDWEIQHDDLLIIDDMVHVNLQMQGTHTNTLDLNMPGLKPVPATHTKVVLPKQKYVFRVMNDKVMEVTPQQMPDAGLMGILKQLGVRIPPIWWLRIMWRNTKLTRKSKTEVV